MKNITFGFVLSMLLTTLMFGMSLSLFAQDDNSPTIIKKEIKIKKIIDADGNETTETIETEVEVNAEDWEDMEGEFDIDIEETIENGVKRRIVRVQAGGENGELPQEIRDELESHGIDINIIEGSEKRTIIIDSDEEGEEGEDHDIRIFKIDSDQEMPEDIRKELEKHGIDLDKIREGGQGIRMYKTEDDSDGNHGINHFFRQENSSNLIDRQTKIFRIASIDDLDNEIVNEIVEMGISESKLRERFDAAENTVRIYKEGLEPSEIEVDAPSTQQQFFFMGDDAEIMEINPNTDLEWVEKKIQQEIDGAKTQQERLEKRTERIRDMINKMSEDRQKAYLGIRMQDSENGVEIVHVAENSPAEKAGLQKGDKVTTLNGETIKETYDIIIQVQEMQAGDALTIGYTRKGEAMTANATLDKVGEPMTPEEKIEMQENFMRTLPDFDKKRERKHRRMGHRPMPRIATERGHLGVHLDPDGTITSVGPESPAADAGLQAGDRLLKIGAISVTTAEEVIKAMQKALPGTNTTVTFQRDNAEQTVSLIPAMPPQHERRFRHRRNTHSPDHKARRIERMKADCERRCNTPFLGIYMEEKDRDFDNYQVKITGIIQHTGAEAAGILEGDILLKINRVSVSNVQDVIDEIAKYEPGDKIKVQVLRNAKKQRIKATLSNQTQADIFSPCDCSTGEVNADAMTTREIILIKENAPQLPIDIATNNTLNLDNIELFPNPNNGTFSIRFVTESKAPTTISVIDVSGKEVYREVIQDFNGRYDNRIDISNQAKGTYFLNISQGDKIYTEQFILGTK